MKKNIILAITIIGLILIIVLKPNFESRTSKITLSDLKIQSIKNITLTSADQDPINFIKTENNWQIVIDDIKNSVSVEKMKPLIALLNAESHDRFPVSTDQLEKYHLLNPRLTVSYDNFTIAFGGSEPLKHRRYVLVNNKVHLIQNLYYHFLLQSAKSFTNKNIN